MTNPLFDRLFAPLAERDSPVLTLADGAILSGRDFSRLVARQAAALAAAGLVPGDRLALQVEKSPEALALYAACVMSGVVFLPLNTAYTAQELDHFISDSQARLVICDPGAETVVLPIAVRSGARVLTLDAQGRGSFATAANSMKPEFSPVSRDEDDLAALLYTSGTTGRSKGAMLTHRNLLSNALALRDLWQFTSDDVLLHVLPIFHSHGLFVATNVVLAAGASMIFLPRFDAGETLRHLPRATVMMGVPTFYTRLLADDGFDGALTRHMRLFISGSAPLLAQTHVEFERRTGHRILERYGLTETSMNTSNPYEGERRAGTVGVPLPGVEIAITDPESGLPVADGQTGMIEVRGPNVFKGYWRMPEKTAAELRGNGFFITGDLGRTDEAGYLQIVGRAKDLIISGGYNVYPKEVEILLDSQTGVEESAVFGVPHPDFGEAVIAVLVPRSGQQPDLDEIRAACGRELARFKHPKRLIPVDSLPRNAMGKVQKNVLRDQYMRLFDGPDPSA